MPLFDRKPRSSDGPGGWWLLRKVEVHLGDDVLVPDWAGWRLQRMPRFPRSDWIELAPDWACEVVSPNTTRTDRILKRPIYAREGVQHLWLVDPEARTLEVFELHEAHWMLVQAFAGNETVRAKPFDAVELEMARWWFEEPVNGGGSEASSGGAESGERLSASE